LLTSPDSLRAELDELDSALEAAIGREADFPHRATVLAVNRRLAERIVAAHGQWLDEVQAPL
jgi:hypothetical protein